MNEAPPIGTLEKAGAEVPMDLDGCSDDDLGEFFVMQWHPSPPPCLLRCARPSLANLVECEVSTMWIASSHM